MDSIPVEARQMEHQPVTEASANGVAAPSFSKPAQFVTIIVSRGPKEAKYVVHKSLICYHSPFFHAAFNSGFIEGRTQEMQMEDVDEEAFGQLVHWLYTTKIERNNYQELLVLGKLWIIAERALMPTLQNHTIEVIYTILEGPMATEIQNDKEILKSFIEMIFEIEKEEHTELRQLLIDHFSFGPSQRINIWAEDLPQKLLAELAKVITKDREWNRRGYVTRPKKSVDYYVDAIENRLGGVASVDEELIQMHASSKTSHSLSEKLMLSIQKEREEFQGRITRGIAKSNNQPDYSFSDSDSDSFLMKPTPVRKHKARRGMFSDFDSSIQSQRGKRQS